MTLVDGCAVGTILLSTIIGCVRGLTREILTLCAWTGAVASTWMCWPMARHLFEGWIENPMLAGGATIIALFILFLILFSLISYFMANIVRQSWMGGVDRSLGALFGVARGAVLLCALEIVLSTFMMRSQHPVWLQSAHCTPLLYQGSDLLATVLPAWINQSLNEQKAKLQPIAQSNVASTVVVNAAVGALQGTNAVASFEKMARLEPKRMPVQEGYSKKQRQDMDRFLSQEPTPAEVPLTFMPVDDSSTG